MTTQYKRSILRLPTPVRVATAARRAAAAVSVEEAEFQDEGLDGALTLLRPAVPH